MRGCATSASAEQQSAVAPVPRRSVSRPWTRRSASSRRSSSCRWRRPAAVHGQCVRGAARAGPACAVLTSASAGTMSPPFSWMRSPGTSSLAGTSPHLPSRQHIVLGASRACRSVVGMSRGATVQCVAGTALAAPSSSSQHLFAQSRPLRLIKAVRGLASMSTTAAAACADAVPVC